jgi:CDP-4-dehydro-6-deoxyglucose reductase, E1
MLSKELMEFQQYWLSGEISMQSEFAWPLMANNVTRSDLDTLISYLQEDDPRLTHGPAVHEFESQWSAWLGVEYSVMLNSGASANDLTMLALREMYGTGEVIVPPLTWVSDVASVLHAGSKPVFVDINPKSLAMDTEKILDAITPRTKAVFLTHVLGLNGLTDKLLSELNRLGIPLIEDVCESHGATHNGQKVGTFGLASNFSFYFAHHMTTIEGGMISTNSPELYEISRMMRSHGMLRENSNVKTKQKYAADFPELNPDFIFTVASHNMRPTELNGILGLSQLARLSSNVDLRTRNFLHFLSVLDPEIFRTDFQIEGSSNYAFTLVLKEASFSLRDEVEMVLKEAKIEFRRGLSGGGNQLRQPYLRNIPGLPNASEMSETEHIHHYSWYIGNYPELKSEQIDWLGSVLNEISGAK